MLTRCDAVETTMVLGCCFTASIVLLQLIVIPASSSSAFFSSLAIRTRRQQRTIHHRRLSMQQPQPQQPRAWYSDPRLHRTDRMEAIENIAADTTRFVLMTKDGILHKESIIDDDDPSNNNDEFQAVPIYLSATQVVNIIVRTDKSISSLKELITSSLNQRTDIIVVWIGKLDENDYWVMYNENFDTGETDQLASFLVGTQSKEWKLRIRPLREFGDWIEYRTDAAVLATANGLIQFHLSHKFCSYCGSPTSSEKAGTVRQCLSSSGTCESKPFYPRIDVATIMLIMTPCRQYALLGRKSSWPAGRYSTLAGFAEVGETLEDCCVRETLEESGVNVDRASVQFITSQPWPFPRSLMVGFHALASAPEHSSDNDGKVAERPKITVNEEEMEDIRWFSKEFVRQRLDGGSSALTYNPNENESEFHIPGKSSLARVLITKWACE